MGVARGSRGRGLRAVGAAAALVVAACSLTSLDGLTGGTPGGADAAGDAPDDAQTGAETAANEGGTHADAAGDATSDAGGDSTPGPFCASLSPAPLFCEDFDHPAPLLAWKPEIGPNGGDAGADDTFGRSLPRSMFDYLPALPDGGEARLEHASLPSSGSWKVGVDLHIESFGTVLNLVRVEATKYAIRFYIGSDAVGYVDEDFTPDGGPSPMKYTIDSVKSSTLLDGAWHRLEIIVDAGTSSSALRSVTVDGQTAFSGGGNAPLSAHLYGAPTSIVLGAAKGSNIPSAWMLHFDDVVFDTAP